MDLDNFVLNSPTLPNRAKGQRTATFSASFLNGILQVSDNYAEMMGYTPEPETEDDEDKKPAPRRAEAAAATTAAPMANDTLQGGMDEGWVQCRCTFAHLHGRWCRQWAWARWYPQVCWDCYRVGGYNPWCGCLCVGCNAPDDLALGKQQQGNADQPDHEAGGEQPSCSHRAVLMRPRVNASPCSLRFYEQGI